MFPAFLLDWNVLLAYLSKNNYGKSWTFAGDDPSICNYFENGPSILHSTDIIIYPESQNLYFNNFNIPYVANQQFP